MLQQRGINFISDGSVNTDVFQSGATKGKHFGVPRVQLCVQLFARHFWLHLPLAYFLLGPRTPNSFFGPSTGLGGAITLLCGTITNTGTRNLNRPRKISLRKLQRAHSRLSYRSQINGSRFMTMGFWSHGLQYRPEFEVIRPRSASSA